MDDFTPPLPFPAPLPSPLRPQLARSGSKQEILDYSLVLASQGVKHWMEFDGGEWSLTVEERDEGVSRDLIETYRAENVGFQDAPPERNELDMLLSPLIFLAVPVAAYFLVELSPWAQWLHSRGSADAARILRGEWWRCLTAATLHADDGHFLSNLVSGYFILNLLNHRLGIGTLMLLATLGAALANFAVALASVPQHISIGYSSVVFCALGLLAAVETLNLIRRGREQMARSGTGSDPSFWTLRFRRLSPLISAFFVAVLVGLGENADIKVHFYGFGLGAALGLATRFQPEGWRRAPVQALLALLAYGLYGAAWMLATRE